MSKPQVETWRILHIDDDEDDNFIVRSMLNEFKGRVVNMEWASTFDEGRKKLIANHYQAVLVDYDLGNGTGIELIREFVDRGYTAPMILLTGRGSYDVDVEAMHAGATLYLTKNEVNALLLERSIRYAIERKQTEQKLREISTALFEREQKLSVALDAAQLGAWTYTFLDHMFEVDERAQQMYHARGAHENHDWVVENFVHPDDVAPMRAALARAADPTGDGHYQMKYRIFEPDSSGAPTHRYRWVNAWGLVEFEGWGAKRHAVRLVGASRDITEQLTLESESRRQRDLLERLVQAAPVGIAFLKGPDHIYELVNREYEHYARGKGELIGHTVAEKWPDIAPIVIPQMDLVYQTGEPFSIQNAPLAIDRGGVQEYEYFSYIFTPIYQADGSIEGLMILAVETTDFVHDRQAVEAQSARLEAVLQSLPVGVWITDETGRVLVTNPMADTIWAGSAYHAASLADYDQYLCWRPETGERVKAEDQPLAQVLRTGEAVTNFEMDIQRLDGSRGRILSAAAPVKNQEGQLIGAVGLAQEITERKQAIEDLRRQSEALRESEERFRQLADAMPQLVWTASSDGSVDYYNQRYQLYAGISQVDGAHWEWGPVLHPDDLQPTVDAWQAAVKSGTMYQFEHRIRMADESYRWHLSRAIPVLYEQGQPVKWYGTATDIHDFKQIQDAFRHREQRMRRLFEANLIGIVTRDASGVILEANDAYLQIIGYTREEVQAGKVKIRDITPPEYHLLDQQCSDELLANRFCKPYEKEYIRGDGSRVPVLIGYSPVENDHLEFIGFVLDLSELKRAQAELAEYAEKLKHSNEELENFAFVASHDLQEPLRKVLMFGDILRRQMGEEISEEAKGSLERMQNAAGRMQAMIQGLLDLSRVNTRGANFERVSLTKVVEDVVSDLEARIHATGGEVIVEPLPEVEGDALQLHQLLQNLISNALKFHKPGVAPVVKVSGELTFTGRIPWARVVVEDNGIGFDAANAERVFTPFTRLQGRGQYEGSGIGLAICRKIVERHGGTISASSQPEAGSRFTILLPVFAQ